MSVLYSIPVHECPECADQLCRGIFHFDKDSKIILHVTKTQNKEKFIVKNKNVIINPEQFETHWGYDMSRVHISNFLYAQKIFDFTHFVILSSNMLPLKSNNAEIRTKNVGFSVVYSTRHHAPAFVDGRHPKGFAYFGALENLIFIQMIQECNFKNVYNCILDGAFVTTDLMKLSSDIYIKYFNFIAQKSFAFEEALLPTLFGNLYTDTIYNSLVYNDGKDEDCLSQPYNFVKKVNRIISDPVRIKYEEMINEKS